MGISLDGRVREASERCGNVFEWKNRKRGEEKRKSISS